MRHYDAMLHLACTLEKSPRAEQRKFSRVEVGAPVSVRARDGGKEYGTIENLSPGGCAITAPGIYPVGARFFVTIANSSRSRAASSGIRAIASGSNSTPRCIRRSSITSRG